MTTDFFRVETEKHEWPRIVRRFGLFLTVGQYGIRHFELGIGTRRDGRIGVIRRVQYGNGWPALRSLADVLALNIRIRRSLVDTEI